MNIITTVEKKFCNIKKMFMKNKIVTLINNLISTISNNSTQIFLLIIMFLSTLLVQLTIALNPPITNKRGGTADNVQFVGVNNGFSLNDEFIDIGRDLCIGGDLIINFVINTK